MRFEPHQPPRRFEVGAGRKVTLYDCGDCQLDPDEQITLRTESGAEVDIARKSWGFYATPSLNARLPQFGWRAALVKSPGARYYIFLQEKGKEAEWERYLREEHHEVVAWLDSSEALQRLESLIKGSPCQLSR